MTDVVADNSSPYSGQRAIEEFKFRLWMFLPWRNEWSFDCELILDVFICFPSLARVSHQRNSSDPPRQERNSSRIFCHIARQDLTPYFLWKLKKWKGKEIVHEIVTTIIIPALTNHAFNLLQCWQFVSCISGERRSANVWWDFFPDDSWVRKTFFFRSSLSNRSSSMVLTGIISLICLSRAIFRWNTTSWQA